MAEKRSEYSFPLGGYTILGDVRSGVIDSVGVPAGWNEIANYQSPAAYAIESGAPIEGWMLAAGLAFRMSDGTSASPALAWGNPTWAEGIYRIAQGTLGVSMDILPSASGKDLGAATSTWDAWLGALNVASAASFSGTVTISGLAAPQVVFASGAGELAGDTGLTYVDPVLRVGAANASTGYVAFAHAATTILGLIEPPIWIASVHITLPNASGTLESQVNKDAANGYAGLNSGSRVTKGAITTDDLIVDNNAKGVVLKDDQATAHYWRVQVASLGTLTTTDLGTSAP